VPRSHFLRVERADPACASLQVFTEAEDGDAVFDEYVGLLNKFVADSNVNAQVWRADLSKLSGCLRRLSFSLGAMGRSSNNSNRWLVPWGQDKGIEACCAFARKAPQGAVKQAAGCVWCRLRA
jgi:hypothetical protein